MGNSEMGSVIQKTVIETKENIFFFLRRRVTTRGDIVPFYARLIAKGITETVDFKDINDGIIKNWSISGLNFIKKEAWKNYGKYLQKKN